MSLMENHIVETYTELLEGLSDSSKIDIINNLSKSLNATNDAKDVAFYRSFGAFASDKSAEEIIEEIRSSRNFYRKDIEW